MHPVIAVSLIFIMQILQLLELLMNFGYYDNMHCIRTIVHPLTAMLDGRTDIPYASECTYAIHMYCV